MNTKPCGKCGLIQPYDELFGLCICGSKEAECFGCPTEAQVKEILPEAKYDRSIIRIERPIFPL